MVARKKSEGDKKSADPGTAKARRAKKQVAETPAAPDPAVEDQALEVSGVVAIPAITGGSGYEEGSTVPIIEKMIVFHLDAQKYGIPINSVQEIQQIVALSEVPGGGLGVIGMVNLRGTVIPALDLRVLVGLPAMKFHLNTPMLICRTRGHLVALLVDEVEDVVTLPENCLGPPPQMHGLADRMLGVCRMDGGLIYLFDVDGLLSPIDLSVLGSVSA